MSRQSFRGLCLACFHSWCSKLHTDLPAGQTSRPEPCPRSRADARGGREALINGKETGGGGGLCGPEGYLQPIDFGSPFAELIWGHVQEAYPQHGTWKKEAERLLTPPAALRPSGPASPHSTDHGACSFHTSAPPGLPGAPEWAAKASPVLQEQRVSGWTGRFYLHFSLCLKVFLNIGRWTGRWVC